MMDPQQEEKLGFDVPVRQIASTYKWAATRLDGFPIRHSSFGFLEHQRPFSCHLKELLGRGASAFGKDWFRGGGARILDYVPMTKGFLPGLH